MPRGGKGQTRRGRARPQHELPAPVRAVQKADLVLISRMPAVISARYGTNFLRESFPAKGYAVAFQSVQIHSFSFLWEAARKKRAAADIALQL